MMGVMFLRKQQKRTSFYLGFSCDGGDDGSCGQLASCVGGHLWFVHVHDAFRAHVHDGTSGHDETSFRGACEFHGGDGRHLHS